MPNFKVIFTVRVRELDATGPGTYFDLQFDTAAPNELEAATIVAKRLEAVVSPKAPEVPAAPAQDRYERDIL